jgi:hypothetical protein
MAEPKPSYNRTPGDTIRPLSSPSRSTPDDNLASSPEDAAPEPQYSANNLRSNARFISASDPGMPIETEMESRQSQERRGENKKGGTVKAPPSLIDQQFVVKMYVIAVFFDLAGLITGGILGAILSPFVSALYYYLYTKRGIEMKGAKRMFVMVIGIPLNVFPLFGWTLQTTAMILSVRADEKVFGTKEKSEKKLGFM